VSTPSLRVSDADREAVAGRLRAHVLGLAGRLVVQRERGAPSGRKRRTRTPPRHDRAAFSHSFTSLARTSS
jgi:hypothetical protein